MTINETTIKGRWHEIKGDIQKAWGKLTDDELEKTKGDMKSISGLIQQRYGDAKEDYSKKLSDIYAKFEEKKDAAVVGIKEKLKS